MISGISSALSGVSASLKRMDVSAHNTANLSTSGFKKDTILQSEGKTGGVVVHIEKSVSTGPQLPSQKGMAIERSNVNLVEEIVEQTRAKAGLGASLAVLSSINQAEQRIIDIIV